jgi:MFS family permease
LNDLPPAISDATGTGPGKVYRAGTLAYTKPALAVLFFWLLWGDFCYFLMEAVVPSIMPLKFKALEASNTLIGLVVVSIPMSMGLVANPIISYQSDRCRSRWGRRIPYILFSVPFLVISLIGLGFGLEITGHLRGILGPLVAGWSPNTLAIAVISVLMILFSFFNTFVNAVYWYLFNDVVPEHLLARFMSFFRLVSLGTGSLYQLFIFQYANTYSTWIFVGAALIYLFGFGLMCLNVKEGKYPPPPENMDGKTGVVSAVKTYAQECLGHRLYWYQFLSQTFGACGASILVYSIFGSLALGLSLQQIGTIASAGTITTACLMPVSGWLADRYHPIRLVLASSLFNFVVLCPLGLIWLFWIPSPTVVFWYFMATTVLLGAPNGALSLVGDPPLLMRLFPRSRYGQFCSANNLWRSIGFAGGAPLAGMYLDFVTSHSKTSCPYFFIPYWQMACSALSVVCIYHLYQTWKALGGDEAYTPPLPKVSQADADLAIAPAEIP